MRDLLSLQPTQCEGDVCAPTLSRGAATPRLFAAYPCWIVADMPSRRAVAVIATCHMAGPRRDRTLS